MKKLTLNKTYLVLFFVTFLALIPIGTVSQQLGNLSIAKFLGYETYLSYSNLYWENDFKKDVINRAMENQYEIKRNLPFEGQKKYEKDAAIINQHDIYITSGGVLQPVLLSTFAFLILIYRKKLSKITFLSFTDWFLVFVTMLLPRQIFNFICNLFLAMSYPDELKIAQLLDLHKGILLLFLGTISLLICLAVIKFIPKTHKKEFVLGAVIGFSVGYFLWMIIFGPIILPNKYS